MGLGRTYCDFRAFLRAEECEAQFDLAFLLHNGHTALDAALWEAGEAEYIFAHAFDWATTPEGRDYWQKIDKKWNKRGGL
ncbi:MAG: hypothetical protein IKY63_02755 [Tidjanibacter sp.]|nr:hypothetical protein [Tidjanibacter sp.]